MAIVGAGVAGLAAAEALKANAPHLSVKLFEKSAWPGGRLVTETQDGVALDTTAQFFTARSPEWMAFTRVWTQKGWLKTWFEKPDERGRSEAVYASPLGLGKLLAHWAVQHDVACGVEVLEFAEAQGRWDLALNRSVFSGPARISAKAVLATPPWPTLESKLGRFLLGLSEQERQGLAGIAYAPCLVLSLILAGKTRVPSPGLLFMPAPEIGCIADQGAKGLAQGEGGLVLLASPEYSLQHYDRGEKEGSDALLALAKPWLGDASVKSIRVAKWKYARVTQSFGQPWLGLATAAPLLICGDGFGGARVEGAFQSGWQAGLELAKRFRSFASA